MLFTPYISSRYPTEIEDGCMKREELPELHYITPIANIPSILERGLLSYKRATSILRRSVAMQEIQARRAKVVVPGGQRLHEYVNLYIHARNPMLYKRQDQHRELCVLRISTDVLDLPGVVVADQNASSGYARFEPAPSGLEIIERDMVFAEYWTHPDDKIKEW
nr:DUF4433 domain-containing protein [Geodermatophilaceae bacterium]